MEKLWLKWYSGVNLIHGLTHRETVLRKSQLDDYQVRLEIKKIKAWLG